MQPVNTQQKPDNFMVWAILSTLFCFLPTGIYAIIHANAVDTLWYEGKQQESIKEMTEARKWTFISAGIGIVGYMAFMMFGLPGYIFCYLLLLTLWLTCTVVYGMGAGASPVIACLLLVGGIAFLCWIIPIIYNFCF